MFEVKDPKIKLFGKTIELLETAAPSAAESGGAGLVQSGDDMGEDCSNQDPYSLSDSMLEYNNLNGDVEEQESNERLSGPKQSDSKEEDQVKPSTTEDLKESKSDGGTMKSSKNEEDQKESSEKTLKKPDKILPCPRCNSMETKFCYFNNYNVNQPRHFCKNCQRYWTAGGTMRNVPVGAGRRKHKHVASQYHHITVPEALPGARIDLQNGVHHPALNPNGTVLTFSSGTPLCESMVSVLSIADKSRNGVHQTEELEASTSQNGENSSSSGSPLTSKDEIAKVGPCLMQNSHLFPPQIPCFPRGQWSYPFYPTFGPTSFPVPFYPTSPPYWPGTWNVPWIIPPTTPTGTTSGPNSPTLGKHSRDGNILKLDNGEEEEAEKETGTEKCLWVPKTLRIDDPNEAAKSSIWATLGIQNERVDSGGSSLCKAFESKLKGGGKTHVPETSTVLQANPAALSRSLSFHESS